MMGRGRFARLSWIFTLALAACATSTSTATSNTTGPTPASSPAPLEIRAELSAPEVADGHLAIVTVHATPQSPVSGQFEHIELPFYAAPELGPDVYQALLGIPFNHKPGMTKVTVHIGAGEGQKTIELPFSVVDGKYSSEILGVSKRFTSPSAREIKRIQRDSAEVGAIYSHITPIRYWKGSFRFPVDSRITSNFGNKRMFNGEMQSFHQGLDLKAPMGTPIRAPAAGRIALAKSLFFTGNTVLIDHGYGFYTLYAHMSQLKVKKGQLVKAGKLLGLSGKTGRASGPHLHWGAIVHRAKVNPLDLTRVLQ